MMSVPMVAKTWKLPMYEASFGLKRRPFAATPDATCFLSAAPIQAALDEIVLCIEQGQGIGVLTAPAGIGKTLLCERLCSELNPRFQTIFLRHASFLTRRALLQTLLCELKHPYHHPSEQELRLELFPAIRNLRPERESLVVICDEAHQLPESLIEELRILADFAESGRPLVRLLLVGQLSLEEKLAQPGLEAFNQRVRAHVNLPTFDRAGSLDYIDYRLTWGGGLTEEIFTPAALEVIARVSDGVPRCINQLADHTLLLAYVAEQRPVEEEIVLEALNDLRQLPLQWNESSVSRHSASTTNLFADEIGSEIETSGSRRDPSTDFFASSSPGMTYSYESAVDKEYSSESANETVEFEAEAEAGMAADQPSPVMSADNETGNSRDDSEVSCDSEDWKNVLSLFSPSQAGVATDTQSIVDSAADVPRDSVSTAEASTIVLNSQPLAPHVTDGFLEEIIIDRYATIDAGLPPISIVLPDASRNHKVHSNLCPPETSLEFSLDRKTPVVPIAQDDFSDLDANADEVFSTLVPVSTETVVETRQEEAGDVATSAEGFSRFDLQPGLPTVPSIRNDDSRYEVDSAGESHSESEGSLDRVDTSHALARPAGLLGPEGESLLKALARDSHREMDLSSVDLVTEQTGSTDEGVWEAIETEAVESTAKQRPFRYLFSKLRRKQQQAH